MYCTLYLVPGVVLRNISTLCVELLWICTHTQVCIFSITKLAAVPKEAVTGALTEQISFPEAPGSPPPPLSMHQNHQTAISDAPYAPAESAPTSIFICLCTRISVCLTSATVLDWFLTRLLPTSSIWREL